MQHRGFIEADDQVTLEAAADDILGPSILRTPGKSKPAGESYHGGTAYERSPHAVGVKGARCYTNANTLQSAANIASTTKHSKYDRAMDENLSLRQKVNRVSCPGSVLQHPLTFN